MEQCLPEIEFKQQVLANTLQVVLALKAAPGSLAIMSLFLNYALPSLKYGAVNIRSIVLKSRI